MLTLNPHTTALVLIDLQKGILGQTLAPYTTQQILPNAVALAQKFADTGGTLALVNVAFSVDGADRLAQPVDAPWTPPPGGLPPGFAEFVPELTPFRAAVHITKRHWGAFHGTELDLQLRRRNITTIVLGGVATNIGVESTAREAWQHNYAVVLAEDATTSLSAELHTFSIKNILPRIARIRSTAEILSALSGK